MRFHDRIDAGRRLATKLSAYRGADVVVYPLPRGGVPLGIEIARALGCPLGLIIPRKIGHPYSPEYAICAVAESGETVCNPEELARVDPAWFERRVEEERTESKRRRERYFKGRAPVPVEGRTAIIVDDGIATGLTMRAAIKDARQRGAARVVVAVPVAPADTAALLRQEVDEVVAVSIDEHYLGAVGAYYDDFRQVSDDEVVAMLEAYTAEHDKVVSKS
jgi:predicted phosphoribosyltransferase